MVADQDGDIVQFNSAAERILGLARQQVIGNHISSLAGLYATAAVQRWLDAVRALAADPTPTSRATILRPACNWTTAASSA